MIKHKTAYWRASPLEPFDVILHGVRIYLRLAHALLEERSIVNTLAPRKDLLPPEEEVIRI